MKAMSLLSLTAILVAFSLAPPTVKAQEKKKDVFVEVEDMPKFKDGGIETFRNWVLTQVKYPEEALKNNISGKVFTQFVVNKKGKVEHIKVIKSPNDLLSNEVIRVVKTSPDWTPGKQSGKAVDVSMTIPVIFKLDGKDKATEKKEDNK